LAQLADRVDDGSNFAGKLLACTSPVGHRDQRH